MPITLETETAKVKGLSFHPTRSWILASLESGIIQLWDYRTGILLEEYMDFYDESVLPVRCVDFHSLQPLFVAGGDNYLIKVFNYKLRRCLFTLKGHIDYVRSVEFHKEQPWIVSASDDHTVRIWNWQSRQCISVLAGHNHYVMCATFHPTENLVASCSIDQNIRVWDISGIKSQKNTGEDFINITQLNQDLFGQDDVMVRFILEGHLSGVNWVAFHPTQNMIVSASDDHMIKLWKFTNDRAWEIETLSGHSYNVSCAKFDEKQEMVVSNSEDGSIKFWDYIKGNVLETYTIENTKFWILATHPKQKLLAAGHDKGFLIFKLHRERPASEMCENSLIYVKDKFIKKYSIKDGSEITIAQLGRSGSKQQPYAISYDKFSKHILITDRPRTLKKNGGRRLQNKDTWELYRLPQSKGRTVETIKKVHAGDGSAAVFISARMYAVLNKGKLTLRTVNKSGKRTIEMPSEIGNVENIFSATVGTILLKTSSHIHLFDFEQMQVMESRKLKDVRFVSWSENKETLALMTKHYIAITDAKLNVKCSTHEMIRIKSGAFDNHGIFMYSTLNHLKYMLPNGDSGTIRTLDQPIYIVKVINKQIHYVNRDGIARMLHIDNTECLFKLALCNGQTSKINKIIGSSKILGKSMISYLQKKGYPSIALRFVEDIETKFKLAIECGKINIAKKCAHQLDQPEIWKQLAAEATKHGDFETVEKCYQNVRNYDQLSFHYLINGSMQNVQNMTNLAVKKDNMQSAYQNSMYLGDVEKRVRLLRKMGKLKLAFVMANVHGLTSLAEEIKNSIEGEFEMPTFSHTPSLFQPPTPVNPNQGNWPLLRTDDDDEELLTQQDDDAAVGDDDAAWENMEGIPGLEDEFSKEATQETVGEDGEEEEQWETLGDDIVGDIDAIDLDQSDSNEVTAFSEPTEGRDMADLWVDNSRFPLDAIASGEFVIAMDLLNKALGIRNFETLKSHFMAIYSTARLMMPLSNQLPSLMLPLQRNDFDASIELEERKHQSLPAYSSTYLLETIETAAKEGSKLVTSGKNDEALDLFTDLLNRLPFVIISSKKENLRYQDVLTKISEYKLACTLKKEMNDADDKRRCELSAYYTRCNLSSTNIKMGLNTAMVTNFKAENIKFAATFAKRLVKLSPPASIAKTARFILAKAEQAEAANKHELNYDDRNPFIVCGYSHSPIYIGSESITCSFCAAKCLPKFQGKTCKVCNLGTLGTKTGS
eukprot:CAMPEP_0117430052 /NCGR_PEP_ID=MMETSP0758-20121206/9575_1 /TAXON_ID=63605 /ORGANISM="Percolomonas cosmopolitus, Strain AE-1 (ATCC 50343)" /LENGTH=1221 /DNA_ID=CAMNT_0005217653 /DNA_START=28 /DNA_END=3689 /DNA_ORIENTATION=+